jgi:hypothetical protein
LKAILRWKEKKRHFTYGTSTPPWTPLRLSIFPLGPAGSGSITALSIAPGADLGLHVSLISFSHPVHFIDQANRQLL